MTQDCPFVISCKHVNYPEKYILSQRLHKSGMSGFVFLINPSSSQAGSHIGLITSVKSNLAWNL